MHDKAILRTVKKLMTTCCKCGDYEKRCEVCLRVFG